MSPAKTASSASHEQTKLLRRLADVVADCRALFLRRLHETGSGQELRQPHEQQELHALSVLLHLMAWRILEGKKLSSVFQDVTCPDDLLGKFAAMQKVCARFSEHRLMFIDCPGGVSNDDLNSVWQMLHSEEFEPLWQQSTTLGYAYQYFAKPLRRETQTHIQSANKELSHRQLIAFTQLYTPGWIVQFLLQNTILPQLTQSTGAPSINRDWLILSNGKMDSPLTWQERLSDFTLIDPACGSGHFLAHAFRFLFDLNRQTVDQARTAADLTLKQLHGADIDRSALAVCALTMLIEYVEQANCLPQARWHGLQSVGDETLGSLRRDFDTTHILMRKYSVVVTNPPYIGRKLMSRELKSGLKQNYPQSHHDLCAPFMVRGLELLKSGGYLGFITQSSLLSLPSYAQVRNLLTSSASLLCAVELGSGVFPMQGGEKVNSVLIVADAKAKGTTPSLFIDLSDHADKERELRKLAQKARSSGENSLADRNVFIRDLKLFHRSPQRAFQYRCPPFLFELFSRLPQLSSVADVRQGLATTDNSRFLKYWWEVEESEIGTIWFPYIKGAGTERWTSPVLHVVNFADNGREIKESVTTKYPYLKGKTAWVVKNEQYYFRAGLCFSFVSAEQFAVRMLPGGCIFDVAASAIFAEESERMFLLAYMNSRLIRAMRKVFNPTINMQVGDVKRLPLFSLSGQTKLELGALARECVAHKERIDDLLLPGLRKGVPCLLSPLPSDAQPQKRFLSLIEEYRLRVKSLNQIEEQIDRTVLEESLELRALPDRNKIELIEWIDRECSEAGSLPANVEASNLAELSLLFAMMNGGAACAGVNPFRTWIENTLDIDLATLPKERLHSIAKRHFRGRLPHAARQFAPQL